jgi:hypothetical protein
MGPEPSLAHVVVEFPSQILLPGAHAWSLQVPVAGSQYVVTPQIWLDDELAPSSLQRVETWPMQKSDFGSQTLGRHASIEQTMLIAVQSVSFATLSPSAEHVTSFLCSSSHAAPPGWQSQGLQENLPLISVHEDPGGQASTSKASPAALHVSSPDPANPHRRSSFAQTSRTHLPAAQW